MKKAILFLMLFVVVKNHIVSQPNVELKYLNIQPKWHHYSGLESDINFYTNRLWGAKKPLIIEDNVYFLTDVYGRFVQGYLFEALKLDDGNLVYKNSYNTAAKNERKLAFAMKREGNDVRLLMFKEDSRSFPDWPFIWAKAKMHIQKYCSATQTMCDSIVTDPLDSRNKLTYAYNQSIFKVKENYLNIWHQKDYLTADKTNYAIFTKVLLDKKGYLIDSTRISIPCKYDVKRHFSREYSDNKYLGFIITGDDVNSDIKMAYFDESFNLEKVLDLNPQIPKGKATHNLIFYDEQNFIINSEEKFYKNDSLKYRITLSHFNHEGTKLGEVVFLPETKTYVGEAACILQPSKKMLAMIHNKQDKKSALTFYMTGETNQVEKLKTVEFSHGIINRGLHPMPNNHFIFQAYYSDSTQFKYDNYAGYTFWSMFTPESIGFVTPTKDINQSTFGFYPNPANQQIHIETNLDYDAVNVYSIDGRLLQSVENQGNTIDVATLPSGLYFFDLWQQGKAITRKEKFVKLE